MPCIMCLRSCSIMTPQCRRMYGTPTISKETALRRLEDQLDDYLDDMIDIMLQCFFRKVFKQLSDQEK